MNTSTDPFYDDYFSRMIDVLELLCASPSEQCEVMDSYNTGWELRHDTIAAIEAVVGSPANQLPLDQVELLRTVQTMTSSLPADAISAPGKDMHTRDGCETAMRHPAWDEIRRYTSDVRKALDVSILLHRARIHE